MAMTYQNFASLGVNLNRQKYGPLDISSVFTSAADLKYYLTKGTFTEGVSEYWYKNANEKVVPYPYEGQVLATVIDGNTKVYVLRLDAEGNFEAKAIEPEVDGKTVKLTNGKLELVGLPTDTSKVYVPSLVNGVLTWAEPDTSTAEGQQQAIEGLTTSVANLGTVVNGKAAEGEEGTEGYVPATKGLVERVTDIEADYLVEADLNDYAKTADVVASDDFESFKTTNTQAINKAKEDAQSAAESTAANALATARTEISKEIDDDVKVAKDRADAAYTLAESKVDSTTYANDKKDLEDEDKAIRAIAEEAKSKIDTFLTSEEVDDTVNTLKEVKAELDKMADATEMVSALAGKADKTALEAVEDRVEAIEDTYATKTEVQTVDNKFASYTTTEGLTTLLAGKQDVIAEGTYATPAEVEAAKSAAATDATNKADAAKDAAIADAAAKLANKANVSDVYSKSQTYSQAEVNALIDQVTGGDTSETATSVKLQLDNYKKIVNTEVWGNEEATGDSRIDKLEAVGAQANVIESVIAAEGAKITATKSEKTITIDDSAIVALINAAQQQANKGVQDAANVAADLATANLAIADNTREIGAAKSSINTVNTTLTEKITALEVKDTTIEGNITALQTTVGGHNTTITEQGVAIAALQDKDAELAGLVQANTDKFAGYYTKGEADAAIKAAIDAIPATDFTGYATETYVTDAIAAVNTEVAKKADAADVYTIAQANEKFLTEAQVDARLNTLIDGANSEDTITNVTNLVEFVNDNAGDIAKLVTDVENNGKAIKKNADDIVDINNTIAAIVQPKGSEEISVAADGTLGLGKVSVNKLYIPEGDTLVIDGGAAK